MKAAHTDEMNWLPLSEVSLLWDSEPGNPAVYSGGSTARVAEPENLKTVMVPVPTFYLITVLVPTLVPGHIHAYTYVR
jgi:hypothetical protein